MKKFLLNQYAALKVIFTHLVTLDTWLGISLTLLCTLYVHFYWMDDARDYSMNWFLLSFATIIPMGVSIQESFTRREDGLKAIAQLRSAIFQLYLAHGAWNFDGPSELERKMPLDRQSHSESIMIILRLVLSNMHQFLALPCITRARHRETQFCKHEVEEIRHLGDTIFHDARVVLMKELSAKAEILKERNLGLPEAIRIRQFERFMCQSMDMLHNLKYYRTPQALRSFARLFSILLPPLYSPAFSQLIQKTNSLGFGLSFALLVSLVLGIFFNSIYYIEDPFVTPIWTMLDNIDIKKELVDLSTEGLECAKQTLFST